MLKQSFSYLADLFPPSHRVNCSKCGGRSYVFGIPSDDPTREVLACSFCGFLFHYPCLKCGGDTALPEGKNEQGFSYVCKKCDSRYVKPPGWLERPADYQEKVFSYLHRQRSNKERVAEALK